ncbi:MAG: (Fe-S)-binding protein [Anaerolineae bacterium]|nr:(Fe-S)-binding protein [Anaerolineae bacterium]
MTQIHPHGTRPDPKNKPVSLFVTCIVDMIYPNTGMATVELLERLGVQVDFPMGQTCCGQMGFNAGYRDEARNVAKQFLKAFKDSEVIVSPSGSCTSMVRHFYPQLFADDAALKAEMERIVSITWELGEYLVDGLGVTDVGTTLKKPTKVSIHDACHGLRMSNLKDQPRLLLSNVKNLEVVELSGADQCCGFGGLFAVKMPDVSGAMLKDKVQNIESVEADLIVTGDASCLTQMNGGLSRSKSKKRVVHFAEVLAGKV